MDHKGALEVLALARDVETHVTAEDSGDWVARLDSRVDDIEPAAQALLAAGEAESALDLVGALSVFWQDAGRVGQGRDLTASVLAAAPATAGPQRARALLVVGQLAFRQGDQEAAAETSAAARDMAIECNEPVVAARAELNLARVAFRDGDAPRIAEHAERAQALAGEDLQVRAGAIHMLGWAAYTAGDINAAMARFEANARLYREAGNLLDAASELANLGDLAAEMGDFDAGARYLREALSVPGGEASSYLAPSLVRSAGVLAAQAGSPSDALALFAAADRFYDEFGLVADPGDDVSPAAYESALAAVDSAAAATARKRAGDWTLSDAVAHAAQALA